MKAKIILLVLSVAVSLVATELFLRAVEPPEYPDASPAIHFWKSSDVLGWNGRPNVVGTFASGFCNGHIVLDSLGNRQNDSVSTFEPGSKNIFFIGDSNTAALEVDGDQTLPALLEQGLRAHGMKVNILNLGVRGYGTDQSVRKALLHAEKFKPEQIIYMYTDNDVFDNNMLRQLFRLFGKGVYLRRGETFEVLNYPVPDYENGYFGVVVLDPEGEPLIYEGTLLPSDVSVTPGRSRSSWRLLRKLEQLRERPVRRLLRRWEEARVDPYELIQIDGHREEDVLASLVVGLVDGGRLRSQHREYYDSQLEFLIGRLWEIPSLRRIHLVEYPSAPTIELWKNDEPSDNDRVFNDLFDRGIVDSYVGFSREMHDQNLSFDDFNCRGGGHFADQGYRWMAEILLAEIDFDLPPQDPARPDEGLR